MESSAVAIQSLDDFEQDEKETWKEVITLENIRQRIIGTNFGKLITLSRNIGFDGDLYIFRNVYEFNFSGVKGEYWTRKSSEKLRPTCMVKLYDTGDTIMELNPEYLDADILLGEVGL